MTQNTSRYSQHLDLNRRHGTARRYKRVLKTFVECFLSDFHPGVQNLRQIKPAHIEDYKRRRVNGEILEHENPEDLKREDQLRKELENNPIAGTRADNAKFGFLGRKKMHANITPKTVNFELQTIGTFLEWALRQDLIFTNPTSVVERFRIPKRNLPKFIPQEELDAFFKACTPEDFRTFHTMLLSGMRRGEVCNLAWADVRFDLGIIFIQAKEDWQPKSDERIIPISPMLHNILRQQFQNRQSERWVFPNRNGNRETHLLDKLKTICKRAGIPARTLHAIRHSFGTYLRLAGTPLADITDLMGHKDLATTQIYAKAQLGISGMRSSISTHWFKYRD